jgi:hypothetical protein
MTHITLDKKRILKILAMHLHTQKPIYQRFLGKAIESLIQLQVESILLKGNKINLKMT